MSDWIAAHGGLIGLGVQVAKYLLVVFSVVSIGVMFERAVTLRRIRRVEEADYRAMKNDLLRHNVDAALSTARDSSAPCAAVLQTGFETSELSEERQSEAVNQEIAVQTALLGRNLSILATVASTAPYVGLFGTVLGILDAFDRISATGQTGAKVVAGSISEALIATALGLGVAIPAVMAYNYFSGRVNDLALAAETHGLALAARLPRGQKVAAPSAPRGGSPAFKAPVGNAGSTSAVGSASPSRAVSTITPGTIGAGGESVAGG